MAELKNRVLLVSGRLLVAHSLVSLLEGKSGISVIKTSTNLHDALAYAHQDRPDVIVVDLPPGADYFIDRPISVEGQDIKTIVLIESQSDGDAKLYLHMPGRPADLQNLVAAIVLSTEPGVPQVESPEVTK